MWSDLVLNPGPLTYESGALTTALRGPATVCRINSEKLRIEKNCSSIGGHIHFSGDIDNLTGLVAE